MSEHKTNTKEMETKEIRNPNQIIYTRVQTNRNDITDFIDSSGLGVGTGTICRRIEIQLRKGINWNLVIHVDVLVGYYDLPWVNVSLHCFEHFANCFVIERIKS